MVTVLPKVCASSSVWDKNNTINSRNREQTNSQIYGSMPLLIYLIHKLLMTCLFTWNKNMNELEFIPIESFLIPIPLFVIKFQIFENEFFFLITFLWDPQPFRFLYRLVNTKNSTNENQFLYSHIHSK